MTLPPLVVDVCIVAPGRKRIRVWLPLFLLWPLLLALGVLALLIAVWVDAVLFVTARRFHKYSRLLWVTFVALGDARGLQVAIDSHNTTVHVAVA